MANTGLLGINPFQKGVNIDISSKPTNLVIQGIQKDAAKKEALDKYFMDYEKSLNPAGMRNQESNIFLQKLNENKQYYLKNRDRILNPAKYGADAQSQYTANFKDMLNLIDQSKTAAANDKVFMTYLNQAHTAGKRTSDNALDMLKLSGNPIGQGYHAPDASLVEIYNPHDEKKFIDAAWAGVPLEKSTQNFDEIINGKKTGKIFPVTTEIVTPEAAKSATTSAASLYDTDHGTKEHFDKLTRDNDFVNEVTPVFKKWYNREIQNGKDLAVAYALAQKQGGLLSQGASKRDTDPYDLARYRSRLALGNILANKSAQVPQTPPANLFDAVGSGFEGTGSSLIVGKDKKIVNGMVMTNDGNPFNGEIFLKRETLPASLYNVLKAGGSKKSEVDRNTGFSAYIKDGRIQVLKDQKLGAFDRQTIQDMQLKWNTESAKGMQPGFVNSPPALSTESKKPSTKTGNVR